MKTKKIKVRRTVITIMAAVCAISSFSAISASAYTHSLEYTAKGSTKVSVILRSSGYTNLIISPLQCRTKNGSNYSYVRDTNSTGNGTSIYAGVTPGTGWKLVASSTYDYTKYKVGTGSTYSMDYYWQN